MDFSEIECRRITAWDQEQSVDLCQFVLILPCYVNDFVDLAFGRIFEVQEIRRRTINSITINKENYLLSNRQKALKI